jgi:hypothetical protein
MQYAKHFQSWLSLTAIILKDCFSKWRCVRHRSRLCIAITFFVRCAHCVVIGEPGMTP